MKNFYLKYQGPISLFLLALALTFVPMMVSAANTALNILGVILLMIAIVNAIKSISTMFTTTDNSIEESNK